MHGVISLLHTQRPVHILGIEAMCLTLKSHVWQWCLVVDVWLGSSSAASVKPLQIVNESESDSAVCTSSTSQSNILRERFNLDSQVLRFSRKGRLFLCTGKLYLHYHWQVFIGWFLTVISFILCVSTKLFK